MVIGSPQNDVILIEYHVVDRNLDALWQIIAGFTAGILLCIM